MKKIIFTGVLAAAIALNTVTLSLASDQAETKVSETSILESSTWFYSQLTGQGQKIYDAMVQMYDRGIMLDGQSSYDLVANGVITNEDANAYMNGDRTLFNNFAAAKDAWDLEHPEAWYIDSSYLSMRTTQDTDGNYHVYIGPGRSDNYYVSGVADAKDVQQKTTALEEDINEIIVGASGTDAEKVKYVHQQVTNNISYRFENECTPGNAGYVRTVYGLVTHEGVCEAYARSMQLILNRLDIECVLVHGVQSSGEPENHMWNAVKIDGSWYVVDATWDDPIGIDKYGNIIYTNNNGIDGGETETYLLVGKEVIGRSWHESGYVSTSETKFSYPEISDVSYGVGVFEKNGLQVTYDDGLMEGTESTVYKVSFNGDGLTESAAKGYYFLVKMYDLNADGSMDSFEDWYYPAHTLHTLTDEFDPDDDFRDNGDKYYTDTDNYLVMSVSNCEYVEFAITTKAPPAWETAMDLIDLGGYYSGDYSDILAETGLMLNVNGNYEQTPYIKNESPKISTPVTAGVKYRVHMEFTDVLYHPDQNSVDNAIEGKLNDAEDAMNQIVALDYRGTTYSWGMNARQPHTFTNKPDPENLVTFCDVHGSHEDFSEVDSTCRITGLEYDFTSSTMWADDSVQYEFYLTGLVGVKSNKYPMNWSYVFENNYPYATCPNISGFNWNLWGQPQLLDNPNDLDLAAMTVSGVNGNEQSLADLTASMNLDEFDMNGRLMLVVESLDNNRDKTEELENAVLEQADIEIPDEAVISKSLYEIDFARICRCTVVKTGQSVRLCVGFPAGIDASMAGITFKAYHFTRDDDGNVISVEEIPCTITQYGLVITCRSFSPFEIVALDNEYLDEEVIDTSKSVVVAAEDGGVFTLEDGTVVSGIDGTIVLEEGDEVVLVAQPNDNMRLVSINVDGRNVDSDGKITISYDGIEGPSTMISASFINEAVAVADEESGETVVVPETITDEEAGSGSEDEPQEPDASEEPTEPGEEEPEHVHNFGDWEYDDDNHWRTCEDDDETETSAHETKVQSNENGHRVVCEICGYESELEEHSYVDGICSICEYEYSDTGSGDDSDNDDTKPGEDNDDETEPGDSEEPGESDNDNEEEPDEGDNDNEEEPDEGGNDNEEEPDEGDNDNEEEPDEGGNDNEEEPDEGGNDNEEEPDEGNNDNDNEEEPDEGGNDNVEEPDDGNNDKDNEEEPDDGNNDKDNEEEPDDGNNDKDNEEEPDDGDLDNEETTTDYIDDKTGVQLIDENGYIAEGAILTVIENNIADENKSISFDITLTDIDGNAVQLNGEIIVKLPVPDDWETENIAVYYVPNEGENENMNAAYIDGYAVFKTTHFSTYLLTVVKTDNNGEGDTSTDDGDNIKPDDSEKPNEDNDNSEEDNNNTNNDNSNGDNNDSNNITEDDNPFTGITNYIAIAGILVFGVIIIGTMLFKEVRKIKYF